MLIASVGRGVGFGLKVRERMGVEMSTVLLPGVPGSLKALPPMEVVLPLNGL